MNLIELKTKVKEYQYLEDTRFIDAALACLVSTRMNQGRPLWLILIGASSSGKTQILRPLAMTDDKFIHSIDDLTENTFLSGARMSKEDKRPMSLLQRIGKVGMIVISDLTGLFSKPADTRNNILGQLRMIYDGEMTKHVGTSATPISWKGHISILAGSTPTIYKHFEEVASFGERFLYYRLHDFDRVKASHVMVGREGEATMDEKLAALYGEYVKEVVLATSAEREKLSGVVVERIIEVASMAELLRVAGAFDFKSDYLTEIPIPAMPMRTVGQLMTLARGLLAMKKHDYGAEAQLDEEDLKTIDWCGYSLVNDKRRACLKVLASVKRGVYVSTAKIGDICGLPTNVVRNVMQVFTAVKVVSRTGDEGGLSWRIVDEGIKKLIRKIEGVVEDVEVVERKATAEESGEIDQATEKALEEWEGLGRAQQSHGG